MSLDCSVWVRYLLKEERKITKCFRMNLMMQMPTAMPIVMAIFR